jgi:hypothetical protein
MKRRVTISSIAVFEGAQTRIFPDMQASNMAMIPVMVCVFPVPGFT